VKHVIDIGNGQVRVSKSDNFKRYCAEVRRYRPLQKEEELRLISIALNGKGKEREEARRTVIMSNQRFAISVAKKYASDDKDNLMDLISECNLGMLEALDKFNPESGTKFISYAAHYMKRSVINYLALKGCQVRITGAQSIYTVKGELANEFAQSEKREPTEDELYDLVNDRMNGKVRDKECLRNVVVETLDGEGDMYSAIRNEADGVCPEENGCLSEIDREHAREIVRWLFKRCTESERKVVKYKFGIDCGHPYTDLEISRMIGVKLSTVKYLYKSAIEKMGSAGGRIRNGTL
jgi:RNA polymerase primary sigma factor